MKQTLLENQGIPKGLLYTLATIAGISVANLYYNQPLLFVRWQMSIIPTLFITFAYVFLNYIRIFNCNKRITVVKYLRFGENPTKEKI